MQDLLIISEKVNEDEIISCFGTEARCERDGRRIIELGKFYISVILDQRILQYYDDDEAWKVAKIYKCFSDPKVFLVRYADFERIKRGLFELKSKGFCLIDDDNEFMGTIDEFLEAF